MTEEPEHPIRRMPINVWRAINSPDAAPFIAKFGNGRAFPIYFEGATEERVRAKAEEFRDGVLAKHEAAFVAREDAKMKARASAERKKSQEAAQ